MEIDWEKLVIDVVSAADYDLGKQLDVETAEEPDLVQDEVDRLVRVAKDSFAEMQH